MPKSVDLRAAFLADEDVVGLDVPVDELAFVSGAERTPAISIRIRGAPAGCRAARPAG